MSKSSVAVSWHPIARQFVRYVGQSVGRNGKSKPHCFYLGNDETSALATAVRLRSDWAALKAAGASAWPTTYLDALKATRVAQVVTAGLLLTGQTVQVATASETVDQVRTSFLTEQRQRMEAGQLARWSYSGIADRLTAVLDRLPPEIAIADKPVRAIDEDQVRAVAFHWASLPVGKVHNQDKRPTTGRYVGVRPKGAPARARRTQGKCISPLYAKHLISAFKTMLVWADECDRWDKPKRFDRIFKLKYPKVHVEAERFTLEEVASLYAACKSDRHRLWILLALNAGLNRTGLATLEWSMVKGLDTASPMIQRLRHKTGVYSRHPLWPETADLLLRQVPNSERRGLVCLSERGEQLVTHQRDAVQSAWRHLVVNAGIRRLSFGKLRKTGAWMAKIIGGLEASEMYLAHGEPGMNKHYAGRDWGKLATTFIAMRNELLTVMHTPD